MDEVAQLEALRHQVEELSLVKHALLPGEELIFLDPSSTYAIELWMHALDEYMTDPEDAIRNLLPATDAAYAGSDGPSAPSHGPNADTHTPDLNSPWGSEGIRIRVGLEDSKAVWYEVDIPRDYPDRALVDGSAGAKVSVKGEAMGREEQARWQEIVRDRMEVAWADECDYPIYQLLSEHLIPLLHDTTSLNSALSKPPPSPEPSTQRPTTRPRKVYHALLTSHHLISPTKRRNLQNLSSTHSLTGFAKVGHPGVLYAEGEREDVEEWVKEVKSWQWLALRVRFVEQLPAKYVSRDDSSIQRQGETSERRRWVEVEKVGDVVDEMRRLGRESYVVEMGIGSVGAGVPPGST